MESFRLEAPRSSNKVRKRTISGSIDSESILFITQAGSGPTNSTDEDPFPKTDLQMVVLPDDKELNGISSHSEPQQTPVNSDLLYAQQTYGQADQKVVRRNMSAPVLDLDNVKKQQRDQDNLQVQEQKTERDDRIGGKVPRAESIQYDKKPMRSSMGHSRATGQRAMSDVGNSGSGKIEWIEEIDALKMMKNGTSFLKYGKWGAPHFRPFRLSQDNTKIIWSSKNKSKDSTQIDIKRIDKVLVGQNTTNFQRHASPELARASFSVVYDKFKTLDVVAKNQAEHNCWIQGLNALIEAARNDELEQLTELIVRLRMMKTDPKSNTIDHVKTPTYSKERALKDYQGLWKVYSRMAERSRLPKLLGSEEFEIVTSKLDVLKEQLNAIDAKIEADELLEIDFMLWQASVEVESINNIISALKL